MELDVLTLEGARLPLRSLAGHRAGLAGRRARPGEGQLLTDGQRAPERRQLVEPRYDALDVLGFLPRWHVGRRKPSRIGALPVATPPGQVAEPGEALGRGHLLDAAVGPAELAFASRLLAAL